MVERIEKDIERLDEASFAAFREWFMEYDQARWDRKIEADSRSGKLDALVDEALGQHRAGKSTPL